MKSLVRTIRRLVSRWRVDASLSSPDDRTAPLEREPFDPASYLARYPDVAKAGMDPYLHYLNHGRAEGRIGAALGPDRSSKPKELEPNRETVLIVSHEATRTGAPILSLNIARELRKKYNVVSLMLRGGALVDDFKPVANLVSCPQGDAGPQDFIIGEVIERMLASCNFRYAIVNSIESRFVLPCLARHFLPTITLIHEFASNTRPRSAVSEASLWSSNAVFSADIVRDDAVRECPDLATQPPVVLPQGRCAVPVRYDTPAAASQEQARIARSFRPDGWPENTVVVVGAGTVHFRKGVDLFIDCAAHVMRSGRGGPCRFVWIGGGYDPDRDRGYSVYLADQVRRAGLEGSFCFLDEVTDIEAAYAQADLLLLSSRLDPLPNVAIDAQGLPVLCFDKTSGIADTLKNHGLEAECVVPYLDSGAMAQRLLEFIESTERRRSVGTRLKQIASDLFDLSSYVEKLDALASKAVQRSRQEKQDFQRVTTTKIFRPDFAANDSLEDKSPEGPARAFVRGWAASFHRRKPFPGFHPGIYQERRGLALPGRDPFVDYLEQGEPPGPWLSQVIAPADSENPPAPKSRIALHLHIYYSDLMSDIPDRLNANAVRPDLFISVPSSSASRQVERLLAGYRGNVADLQVVPNRGRDIGPLLTTFGKKLSDSYDIVGHLHTKKSTDIQDSGSGKIWRLFLLENLLGGQHRMADIILRRMEADPALGLVFPDDPFVVDWTANREVAQTLADRLGLGRLPYTHFNFPVGTMFWVKVAALRPWVDLGLGWNDYPPEPVPYDGSMLHAIERLLPWVAEHEGLRIAVTNVPGMTR